MKLVPLLNVLDGQRSLNFYTQLGFEVLVSMNEPKENLFWARVERDGVQLMINERSEARPSVERSPMGFEDVVFYLEVPDVFRFCADLTQKGLEVSPPQAMPYGVNEASFRDPDGYEWAATSPLSPGHVSTDTFG